jgi:asparagine synthetase B (glutamine-hydrolysing)
MGPETPASAPELIVPGRVVVTGDPRAEERARRLAAPLLRQPWQRLELRTSRAGEAAIGFAGELGGVASDSANGVLVALDGELFGPPRSGPKAAAELLALYLRHGDRLEPPEGSLAAAVWDERRQDVLLLTDAPNRRPVYVMRDGGVLLACGELKGLVAGGVEARLDLGTWAELLAYEFTVSGGAPLAGVRSLPPGTTLVSGPCGERELTRWRLRFELPPHANEAELADELAGRLETSVLQRLDEGTALALSAGLDSRCIAAVLSGSGFTGTAATYGMAGSDDLRIGPDVARAAGLRHRELVLEPGYVARGAAEIVWLDEGFMRCFHAHHLALARLRLDDGCDAVLIGLFGDSIFRTPLIPQAGPTEDDFAGAVHRWWARGDADARLELLFRPAFAAALRGSARAALTRALGRAEGERPARFKEVYFHDNSPTGDIVDFLAARDPTAAAGVMELARLIPYDLRLQGHLQRTYLRRFPALAAIASPTIGFAARRPIRGRSECS